ncbi:hypothetical protein [Tichowtungia aerotolerans]|uniref:Uncharacterized protein n=1 Tax=Tichowtungia aerotolerans TaxID=2697043 RepID=A0A6P1M3B1_9BACT|nr:hypothetical protein [Tichowtungia aerotolerans]QHI68592.1 hypothetical protein GT409_03715 [Tichowtungia aerotolerans]
MKLSREQKGQLLAWHKDQNVSAQYGQTIEFFKKIQLLRTRKQQKLITKNIRNLSLALKAIGLDEQLALTEAASFSPEGKRKSLSDPRRAPREIIFPPHHEMILGLKRLCARYEGMHKAILSNKQPSPYKELAYKIACYIFRELKIVPSTTPDKGAFDKLLRIVVPDPDGKESDLRAIRNAAVDSWKVTHEHCPELFAGD